MKKVKINGQEYNVKYTIRALFYFEKITGKAFEIKTLQDNYILFYCMILANNPDNILEWEDFLDAVDNDPKLIEQLTQINDDYLKKDNILNQVEEKRGQKKNKCSGVICYACAPFQNSDWLCDGQNRVGRDWSVAEISALCGYRRMGNGEISELYFTQKSNKLQGENHRLFAILMGKDRARERGKHNHNSRGNNKVDRGSKGTFNYIK